MQVSNRMELYVMVEMYLYLTVPYGRHQPRIAAEPLKGASATEELNF